MKRVWNLYRVSDDRQHDGEDIPLQRKSCTDFINRNSDWKLENEVYELGVSGYKNIAKDRDVVEILLRAAEKKEFDVLLVFMFDRIGRREDDTPILVQTFCKLGVEVWSVKEGERRFDNHIDKLMNYITFWQANGESDKTSKRVTEKIYQMNDDGDYAGGSAPYGYEVFDTGVRHPKYEKNIKKIRINIKEAEVVLKIFELSVTKGFGSPRIAKWLNENNYVTRIGTAWRHNYILRMLKNRIYIGYKQYGLHKVDKSVINTLKYQPFNINYVLVERNVFDSVQQLIEGRSEEIESKNIYFKSPTKSEFLLTGIVKCGYCNHNLKADYSVKSYTRKSDGLITKMKTLRYTCGHGKEKVIDHSISQFGAKKYELKVVEIVKNEIKKIDKNQFAHGKKQSLLKEANLKNIVLQDNQKLLSEAISDLKGIESLIIKIEIGKSKVPIENAENMLLEQNSKIEKLKLIIDELLLEIESESKQVTLYDYVNKELDNWDQKFDESDIDGKKMMLSRVISHINFKKDKIEIRLIEPLLEVF